MADVLRMIYESWLADHEPYYEEFKKVAKGNDEDQDVHDARELVELYAEVKKLSRELRRVRSATFRENVAALNEAIGKAHVTDTFMSALEGEENEEYRVTRDDLRVMSNLDREKYPGTDETYTNRWDREIDEALRGGD